MSRNVIAGKTGNLHTDDHTSINDNSGAVRRCKSVYIFTPGYRPSSVVLRSHPHCRQGVSIK